MWCRPVEGIWIMDYSKYQTFYVQYSDATRIMDKKVLYLVYFINWILHKLEGITDAIWMTDTTGLRLIIRSGRLYNWKSGSRQRHKIIEHKLWTIDIYELTWLQPRSVPGWSAARCCPHLGPRPWYKMPTYPGQL